MYLFSFLGKFNVREMSLFLRSRSNITFHISRKLDILLTNDQQVFCYIYTYANHFTIFHVFIVEWHRY
ncbi:uncharacterized protein BX663DRAFT_521867 [Cokeromyces recurvatus]|uniref:uncharacterized protein n=1 Tax=Cokeromyces recurvatus TaxID=90255 RepID=UPI00221FE814|nr:uncharacterized protein BX663DRAFT_521867 [Cokeromyces recurvatus]KAI7899228.1 hypothetical protein BX663DRAFT_521867 [Cokeromyces recurvatus]